MGRQNTIAKLTESIVQPDVLGKQFNSLYCQVDEEKKQDCLEEKTPPSKTAGIPLTPDLSERQHYWEEEAGCHRQPAQ